MPVEAKYLSIILFCFFITPFTQAQDPLESAALIDIGGEEAPSQSAAIKAKIPNELPMKKTNINTIAPDGNEHLQSNKSNQIESSSNVETTSSKQRHFKKVTKLKLNQIERSDDEEGNLPDYALRKNYVTKKDEELKDPSFEPGRGETFKLQTLKKGITLYAVIETNILGYPESKAPVTAIITSPPYNGARVLGEATLDTVTKRVNVEFHTLVLKNSLTSYSFKGITSERNGLLGLAGVYRTEFWKWLWAEVAIRSAGGYADASVDRESSLLGGFQTIPTPENAAKKGAVKGLDTIADRMGDKRKAAPEMTEVQGPIQISISVLE